MKSVIIFLLLLAISGCGEEIAIELASPGSLKMQLNHREFVADNTFVLSTPDKGSIHIYGFLQNSSSPNVVDQFLIYLSAPKLGTNVIRGREDYSNLVSYGIPLAPQMKQFYSANIHLPVSGEVVLTQFDLDKKLVSGTFRAILASNDRTETLNIPHGSFTELQIVE